MKNGFVTDGSAAFVHAAMIESSAGDVVMIGAATVEKLERAFAALVGSKLDSANIQHVAVCDAELAKLMQMPAFPNSEAT